MKDPWVLADQLLSELRDGLGPRLRAVSLFGSAARGEWIEGVSDVNVLVLLDDIDAAVLERAAPVVRRAVDQGARPLVMEMGEWGRAADVFPIELADMKDASSTLFGDDPAATVVLDPALMRLQAERELRAKLLHLHSGMLVAAEERARLGDLFVRALPSFVTYLRTVLRLSDRSVPRASSDVIAQGCGLAGADPTGFLQVLEAREAGGTLELSLADALADQFNTAAERLAAFTDAFGR